MKITTVMMIGSENGTNLHIRLPLLLSVYKSLEWTRHHALTCDIFALYSARSGTLVQTCCISVRTAFSTPSASTSLIIQLHHSNTASQYSQSLDNMSKYLSKILQNFKSKLLHRHGMNNQWVTRRFINETLRPSPTRTAGSTQCALELNKLLTRPGV